MIDVKVVLDSISPAGSRLTTMLVTYPRFIHAEVLTHRVFSRNTSSNRAIPAKRVRAMVEDNPVRIEFWGANQRGMSADEEVADVAACEAWWEQCRQHALEMHRKGEELGIHKQVLNRIVEPFQHVTVLLSATSWWNFIQLRTGPKAQPEIQVLARAIKAAYRESKPLFIDDGQWHMPLLLDEDRERTVHERRQISAARCARLSYLNHNGQFSAEDDMRLYQQLADDRHMSPFEHIATPSPGKHGNFSGWKQLRQYIEGGESKGRSYK